jgi:ATP-dependent RNA helicase DDX19/DBP5
VLFSATFDDQIRLYAAKFAPNANEISLKQEELTVEGIRQFYLDCVDDNDKYNVLVKFYGLLTVASSIIFVQVCSRHFSIAIGIVLKFSSDSSNCCRD